MVLEVDVVRKTSALTRLLIVATLCAMTPSGAWAARARTVLDTVDPDMIWDFTPAEGVYGATLMLGVPQSDVISLTFTCIRARQAVAFIVRAASLPAGSAVEVSLSVGRASVTAVGRLEDEGPGGPTVVAEVPWSRGHWLLQSARRGTRLRVRSPGHPYDAPLRGFAGPARQFAAACR